MNSISVITRRNIFDSIQLANVWYAGRLDEVDFLFRLFDLSELPSTDDRFKSAADDIWQHRVNNPYDWPNEWVFYDDRFKLLYCEDAIFLQFLSEMIHPIVRQSMKEVETLLTIYNENLRNDGYEIIEKTKVSGKPVFAGRKIITGSESIRSKSAAISEKLNAEYVTQQINMMESFIDSSPHMAIGLAKELIETCCRKILEERNVELNKDWDLMQLVKHTNRELKLSPADILDEKKASKTIKTILSSLGTVVQGICELRNEYGSGHGKSVSFKGLNARHAKLAVGAATTLAIFLLETHEIR